MNKAEYKTAQKRLNLYHKAWNLVQEQAEYEGLWILTDNIEVGLLQQELRRLHDVIEGGESDSN